MRILDGRHFYTSSCRMNHAEFGPNDHREDEPHCKPLLTHSPSKYYIVKPHKSYFYLMKNGKKRMTHWIWLYNMVIYQYPIIYWLFCIDPEWDLPKQKIANILDFCSQVGRICENKGKLSTKKLAKLRQIFKRFPRMLVNKVGCVFPTVVSSDSHMGQQRDDAPQ